MEQGAFAKLFKAASKIVTYFFGAMAAETFCNV